MTSKTVATSKTQLNGKFRLESCSPRDLVDALVDARGKPEASRILQEASKLLVAAVGGDTNDAAVVSPDEKRSVSDCGTECSTNEDEKLLGRALLSEPIETSFLSPRMGKFSLQLHENGLQATKMNDPSVKLTLLKNSDPSATTGVSHVLLFPKPEDCKAIVYNRKIDSESKPKKVGGNLVVLSLESPVQLPKQKSPTQQLCFALPADKKLGRPIGPSLVEGENSSSEPTEAWGQLLHRALGGRLAQVLAKQEQNGSGKNNHGFKSHQPPNTSVTTAGMPFVSCYLGVNDGVLYPLEEGLLFYKPPRFLPRSNLHSIACGRGGGGGDSSSRYVDMVVQCSKSDNDDGDEGEQIETVEFTNIQREENSVLNSYIHDVLVPAMTKDAKERSKKVDGGDDDGDSDHFEVEAIAEADIDDDATEEDSQIVEVQGEESDDNISDEDDEEFDGNDSESGDDGAEGDDSSDDEVDYGEDDEGIAVVRDEFARELVNQKRRKKKDESATESEDDDSSSGRPRFSKRLRRTGA